VLDFGQFGQNSANPDFNKIDRNPTVLLAFPVTK
jgi:hypothetical protein